MNLWIKSQNRERLMKVDNLKIIYNKEDIEFPYYINATYEHLGAYKTKERALEVLEEISQIIKKGNKNIFKVNIPVDFNTLERIKNCYEEINKQEISLYDNHFELLNKKDNIEIYEMPIE